MTEFLSGLAGLAFLASLAWWVSVMRNARRLARLMKGLKVNEEAIHGWVAVNGNMENTLVIQGVDEEGNPGAGNIPLWLTQETGEAFLKGLKELRAFGAPENCRLARVVVLEVVEGSDNSPD